MRVDYLTGFIQYLEREHDIDLVKDEQSDYGDGQSASHKLSDDTILRLAKEYKQHVINTGEI